MMHHRFFRVLFCFALCGLLTPAQMSCAQTVGEQILLSPDNRRVVEEKLGAPIDWGSEAVRVLTAKRAEISLNGAWNFAPAAGNVAPRNNEWGFARVPGSWRRNTDVLLQGEGARWKDVNFSELSAGWYQRQVRIPADWDGRAIELDFARVATDATIYVNGREAGKINWPEGKLDITRFVTPGQTATIGAFVVATLDRAEVQVLMGQAPGQVYTAKASLHSGGLVGNVTLSSRPGGAHVSDVFVQPSTRTKQLKLDVELAGVRQAGPVQVTAVLLDEKGKEEKRFTQTLNVAAQNEQTAQLAWTWENPRLWEYLQPNLYMLKLQVRGAGLDDEYAQEFGFREFWTQGRALFLNGKEFRMRPTLGSDQWNTQTDALRNKLSFGFNLFELWPEDVESRSYEARHVQWFDIGDTRGLPVTGILPHMGWMGNNVDTPDEQARFLAAAERVMRRYRNHPSIVMWGSSGNMMGGPLDPAYVGQRAKAIAMEVQRGTESGRKSYPLANKMVAEMKKLDPTRPIFIHNGGPGGDLYTINNYLNFIPLQEREEWLSEYVTNGDMPLWYVEFGSPFYSSFMRGRHGYGPTTSTEPLVSEYSAIYFGTDSYRNESEAYLREMASQFVKDQQYRNWHGNKMLAASPNFQMMQDLFIRNTWRSWRTMGITGGMVPWDNGYIEIDGKVTPAGIAMRENNAPTLAWIAGAASTTDKTAFTDKDHNFAPGQTVRKQIVLLNDTRETQPYSLTWQAMVDGKRVGGAKANGRITVAQNIFVPLSFALPTTIASAKVDGVITTNVTIGTAKHSDSFAFRVHRRVAAATAEVMVFDPTGKSIKLLQTLGYKTTTWDGKASTQLLVVGHTALSNTAKAAGDIEAFVRNGGRVLLMAQNPHWVREMLGLRVSHIQSRRVFPVAAHPVIAGLDSLDLRDWNGHSTMLDPRPDYLNGKGPDVKRAPSSYPYAGWRWGTRGTVSSGAIEKPHRSGWRPILEAEFDLQYSPLMELDYGKGRMVWSQLDVEDHAPVDPVARRVARQLIEYSRTAPLAPRRTTTYIGGEAGARQLDALGVQYEKAERAVAADGLVVIGPDANISAEAIEALARNGARVLVLARSQNNAAAGVQLARVGDFLGSLEAPNWPEARGLSASDLRWRNAGTAWLATGGNGAEIGGGGQLARRVVGKGVIVWAQINPEWTAADEKTYLRLTRWRQTRALSQLLANLGAGFEMDARVFQPAAPVLPPQVSLAGSWKSRLIQRLEAAQSPDQGHPDPGMSTQARALLAADVNDSAWQSVDLPGDMAKAGGQWINADGEAVFRKTIEVPASLQGKELVLSLGTVDDFEETWFNGVRVGGVGSDNPNAYSVQRVYTIPANLVKPGRNVIAVRVWDRFGGGGFTGKDFEMTLKEPEKPATAVAGFYHPDYREDFDMGDEPYRYYNW